MSKIVEAESVHFSWNPAGVGWFQDMNLPIERGHIYGLMGRNGAGKTTLLRLLTGCLRPVKGRFLYVGNGLRLNTAGRSPEQLADMVYVPENSELPNLTVKRFAESAGSLYPRFSMPAFLDHLKALEVSVSVKLSKSSFGQRRKAHIAFALATGASLVLLDEPSNGLDIAAQITLRRLLIAHLSPDRSIVISTHHVREFENVFDRMIVLDRGTILANEFTETMLSDSSFKDLETWYANLVGMPSSPASFGGVSHENI